MKKKELLARPEGLIFPGAALLITLLLAVRIGSSSMDASEFFGGLFLESGHETQSVIIYTLRLPRALGAALAGAGLSLAGVLLQGVTGNDLAGPNIIGVNAGAGFAVILMLFLLPEAIGATPFAAFFGAFLSTILIVTVASRVGSSRSTVILAGIAVTVLLNAGIAFVSLLDTDVLASYNHFSIGSLSGVSLDRLPIPAILIGISIAVSLILGRRIDALCLGDAIAVSLGINVKFLRIICMIVASAAAAAAVSFAGLLGFVGLVVPHIARGLCGSTVSRVVPFSTLLGALTVVLADLIGRVIIAPSEVPVGIIMAFIGAPVFFRLLLRRKR